MTTEELERKEVLESVATPYTIYRRYYLGMIDDLRKTRKVELTVQNDGDSVWYSLTWSGGKAQTLITDRERKSACVTTIGDTVPLAGWYDYPKLFVGYF